jgi:signal transduction histidine kinase
VAAYALRQSLALQRSRESLVNTREEERLRIRRDLHDGLGPELAGITLKLDAARNLLARQPDKADALLLELKSQTQAAISTIRRLVYDLRPPALDQLGLEGAIREQIRLYEDKLALHFELNSKLTHLPAAVEVACYRVVQEALTNVVRHAQASEVTLCIQRGEKLELSIEDNGIGLSKDYRSGVGLQSMRERSEELGGSFSITSSSQGGTRITAHWPLSVT